MIRTIKYSFAACMMLSSVSANATLLGDSIAISVDDASYDFTPNNAVVSGGNEFQRVFTNVTTTVDFTADTVTLSYMNTSSFPNITYSALVYTFSGLDWGGTPGGITGISEISNTFPSMINASFTNDSIELDVALTNTNPGDFFAATYRITGRSINAPEPSIFALLCTGLVGLGFIRRQT